LNLETKTIFKSHQNRLTARFSKNVANNVDSSSENSGWHLSPHFVNDTSKAGNA